MPSATECYHRFHLSSHRTVDLNHGAEAALRAYDSGQMDGFSAAQSQYNLPLNLTMGYYDGSDLPLYYNLASNYVLAQRFFSSAWGSSEINHMYADRGARPADTLPATGYDFPTIFDRLQAAGVSWKFYVQNYDPTITFRNHDPTSAKAAQLIWAPLLDFARFIDDPALSSHIVDMQQYYTDLQNGHAAGGGLPGPQRPVRASARRHHRRPVVRRDDGHVADAQLGLGQQPVHADLGRLGRLVRPRPAASGRRRRLRLPRSGDLRLALREVRHDRQHDLRLHVGPEVHRGQLVACSR